MRKRCFCLLITCTFNLSLCAQLRIGNFKEVYAMDISPDKQVLAFAAKDSLQLWNLNTISRTGSYMLGASGNTLSIDYSGRGDKIACGGTDRNVYVFNTEQGNITSQLKGAGGVITSVKFSPDDMFLAAACADHFIYLWSTDFISKPLILSGHHDVVTDVEFMDNDHLAGCDAEGRILIWNISSGTIKADFVANQGWTRDILVNRKRQLISCGDDARVVIREFDNDFNPRTVSTKKLGNDWLISLDQLEDDFTGAVSMNRKVFVYSAQGKYIYKAKDNIHKLLFIPGTIPFKVLFCTRKNGIFFLDAENMKLNR